MIDNDNFESQNHTTVLKKLDFGFTFLSSSKYFLSNIVGSSKISIEPVFLSMLQIFHLKLCLQMFTKYTSSYLQSPHSSRNHF